MERLINEIIGTEISIRPIEKIFKKSLLNKLQNSDLFIITEMIPTIANKDVVIAIERLKYLDEIDDLLI